MRIYFVAEWMSECGLEQMPTRFLFFLFFCCSLVCFAVIKGDDVLNEYSCFMFLFLFDFYILYWNDFMDIWSSQSCLEGLDHSMIILCKNSTIDNLMSTHISFSLFYHSEYGNNSFAFYSNCLSTATFEYGTGFFFVFIHFFIFEI